jgi:hypothetical protein
MKPTHTFYLHHLDLACTTPIFTSRITILTASPTSDTRTPRSCAFIPLYTHVYLSPHRITSHDHNSLGVAYFFRSPKVQRFERVECKFVWSCIALREGMGRNGMGVFLLLLHTYTLSEGVWMQVSLPTPPLLLLHRVDRSRSEDTLVASSLVQSSPV